MCIYVIMFSMKRVVLPWIKLINWTKSINYHMVTDIEKDRFCAMNKRMCICIHVQHTHTARAYNVMSKIHLASLHTARPSSEADLSCVIFSRNFHKIFANRTDHHSVMRNGIPHFSEMTKIRYVKAFLRPSHLYTTFVISTCSIWHCIWLYTFVSRFASFFVSAFKIQMYI